MAKKKKARKAKKRTAAKRKPSLSIKPIRKAINDWIKRARVRVKDDEKFIGAIKKMESAVKGLPPCFKGVGRENEVPIKP